MENHTASQRASCAFVCSVSCDCSNWHVVAHEHTYLSSATREHPESITIHHMKSSQVFRTSSIDPLCVKYHPPQLAARHTRWMLHSNSHCQRPWSPYRWPATLAHCETALLGCLRRLACMHFPQRACDMHAETSSSALLDSKLPAVLVHLRHSHPLAMCLLAPWHFPVCHSMTSYPVFINFLVRQGRVRSWAGAVTVVTGSARCNCITCFFVQFVVRLCVSPRRASSLVEPQVEVRRVQQPYGRSKAPGAGRSNRRTVGSTMAGRACGWMCGVGFCEPRRGLACREGQQ